MGNIEVRSLDDPDEVVAFDHGRSHVVRLAGTLVSRDVHEPGWTWEDHIRPIVGGTSCQFHHRAYVVTGDLRIRSDEGVEMHARAGSVVDVQPGHVAWVEGDEPVVLVDWATGADWAQPKTEGERVLATILLTDIVDSTPTAQRLGDAGWRRELALHDATVRTVLRNHRGREVETAGDSFLAMFDGAARAVRCGTALVEAVRGLDLSIRVGIHTGEVEFENGHLRGVAVHLAARVMAMAAADEVLVTSTTRELSEGSGLEFTSRGRHVLKGIEGDRELFATQPARGG